MHQSRPSSLFRKLFFGLLALGAALACVRTQADDTRIFEDLDVPPLPSLFLTTDAKSDEKADLPPNPPEPPTPAKVVEELPVIRPNGTTDLPALPTPPPASKPVETDEEWVVHIIPGPSRARHINGQDYESVYQSIPFKKAEYRANPGYRHEATMEVLFGQQRPTTIVNQRQPEVIPLPQYTPYAPYRYGSYELQRNYQPGLVPRPNINYSSSGPYGPYTYFPRW
ncbi:MAG: hypothetical protein R3C01_03280 [Planctomycetaceae bacterium]